MSCRSTCVMSSVASSAVAQCTNARSPTIAAMLSVAAGSNRTGCNGMSDSTIHAGTCSGRGGRVGRYVSLACTPIGSPTVEEEDEEDAITSYGM